MAQDPEEDRIRRKAHELWEAQGCPHGRDRDHWEEAREIVAIQDSQASTLLPRDTGATQPVESRVLAESHGDVPNLTDQGDSGLTDVGRETGASAPAALDSSGGPAPASAEPSHAAPRVEKSGMKHAAKLAAKGDSPVKSGKSALAKKKK